MCQIHKGLHYTRNHIVDICWVGLDILNEIVETDSVEDRIADESNSWPY